MTFKTIFRRKTDCVAFKSRYLATLHTPIDSLQCRSGAELHDCIPINKKAARLSRVLKKREKRI